MFNTTMETVCSCNHLEMSKIWNPWADALGECLGPERSSLSKLLRLLAEDNRKKYTKAKCLDVSYGRHKPLMMHSKSEAETKRMFEMAKKTMGEMFVKIERWVEKEKKDKP